MFPPAMPRAISLWLRIAGLAALAIGAPAPAVFAQTPPVPSAEAQIYERYRAWVTRQPPDGSPKELLDRYRQVLAGEGMAPADVDRHLRVIAEQGRDLEIERWNRILTSEKPNFNVLPNQFLVDRTKALKPGRALDVGMGQGRNALYLAKLGWDVTGFDPAEKAVALAQARAKKLGLKIKTQIAYDTDFDFGKERWDLILFSWVAPGRAAAKAVEGLKPGGVIVLESSTTLLPTKDILLQWFKPLRVLQHTQETGKSDFFGRQDQEIIRFLAEKPRQ